MIEEYESQEIVIDWTPYDLYDLILYPELLYLSIVSSLDRLV